MLQSNSDACRAKTESWSRFVTDATELLEKFPEGLCLDFLSFQVVELPKDLLVLHEAAELLSELPKKQYDALQKDIEQDGIHTPLVAVPSLQVGDNDALKFEIIDGRHRLSVAMASDVIRNVPVRLSDPGELNLAELVLSLNQRRRDLPTGPRALSAARICEVFAKDAAARMRAGKRHSTPLAGGDIEEAASGTARDLAGKEFTISGRTVGDALSVIQSGNSELVESVESGTLSVSKAAKLARASDEDLEQLQELVCGINEVGPQAKEAKSKINEFLKRTEARTKFNEGRNGTAVSVPAPLFDDMAMTSAEVNRELKKLSTIEKWVNKQLDTAIAPQRELERVLKRIRGLHNSLHCLLPEDPCPNCIKQDGSMSCTLCNGRGWLRKRDLEQHSPGHPSQCPSSGSEFTN